MSVQLKNFFVCDMAVVGFDGKISLINLFSEIISTAFPVINPKFTVLVSIIGDNGPHFESIEIISLQNEKVVATLNGSAEIKGSTGNNFLANFINTQFPTEGQYWIKVTVDQVVLTNKNDHLITVKKINTP